MSMIAVLSTLTDSTLDCVLATPELVWRIIAPDDPEMWREAKPARSGGGWLARLFGKMEPAPPPPPPVQELTLAEDELHQVDLDKSWHGLHFLLTGSAWDGAPPLNFLVAGGTEVGDIDVGYGPARAFRAAEVAQIDQALGVLSADELKRRFNPAEDDETSDLSHNLGPRPRRRRYAGVSAGVLPGATGIHPYGGGQGTGDDRDHTVAGKTHYHATASLPPISANGPVSSYAWTILLPGRAVLRRLTAGRHRHR